MYRKSLSWKNNVLLVLILLLAFVLRIIAIQIDPFLHPWDERFHALVARNMMTSPFTPILRVNPITDNYNKFMWCCNHIWLHKQPLFMWQMALSLKIFGVSEWSMRLPSALMGTLLVLIIYRIAILMNLRKRVALFTALLLACSNFHLQMIAGIHGMDHNDVAHGFYVLASIWALFEYQKSKKGYWVILIGVFSGAAILIKWLTGLLVYLIWGLLLLASVYKRNPIKKQVFLLMSSLAVCCLVFLPWQLYILHRFPDLAAHEYEFNRRHISEALEGHGGGYLFYFSVLNYLFGEYLYYLLPLGIFISFKIQTINSNLNIGVLTAIGFVFLFYSIVVKTKVDTHIFFIVPLALLYVSIALDWLITRLAPVVKPIYTIPVLLSLAAACSLNPQWIFNYLSPNNKERNDRIYNANIYRNLSKELPAGFHVVMNMNSYEGIDVMFYNKGITAYHWTLSEDDFISFTQRKIPIAVFEPHGNYSLPEYVLHYPYLYIIREKLKDMP